MEFRLLGPLEVISGEKRISIGGPKQRALLAVLLLHPNEVVSDDRLIEAIWSDAPPPTAQHGLEVYATGLRRALGEADRLVRVMGGYRLRTQAGERDLDRLEHLLGEGRAALAAGDPETARAALVRALELWRGEALADLADRPFAQIEMARLEELRLTTLEERIEADLALGRHADLVGELKGVVIVHPFRERLWEQLMLALYRSGRQAEALRMYQRLKDLLREELGIDPGLELQQLEEEILMQASRLELVRPRRHNLPTEPSSFIGRENELQEIRELVERARLVTLTGTGGSGKTRLALEVATRLLERYPGGVWLVELASLTQHELVLWAVADAVGVKDRPGVALSQVLREHLGSRRTLLLIDNCEHLLGGVAGLLADLVRACPLLHVVATSRQPLGLPGEAVFVVPPLSLPDGDLMDPHTLLRSEAVRLFVERAEAAKFGFIIDEYNAPAIVRICRRLDGLPLALELAAVGVRALGIEQIASGIEDGFYPLADAARQGPARQQTLRATMDWSYHLLDETEQAVLRRLSAFRAGFSLEEAVAVCEGRPVEGRDVLRLVSALVDRSLVGTGPAGGSVRYRLLETVAQYAAERLSESGEEGAAHLRHAYCFLALTERAEPELRRHGQALWAKRLDDELQNLRIAFRRLLASGDSEAALRLAASIWWWFWLFRNDLGAEGRQWLLEALQAGTGASPGIRAKALLGVGMLALSLHSDLGAAASRFREALALYRHLGDVWGTSFALRGLGTVAVREGRSREAESLLSEAMELATQGGYTLEIAFTTSVLGEEAYRRGDHARAARLYEESTALYRREGHRRAAAWSLFHRWEALGEAVEAEPAREALEEARAVLHELGDRHGTAQLLRHLGLLWLKDDAASAATLACQALALFDEVGDVDGVARCLQDLARTAFVHHEPVRAARLLGAAAGFRDRFGLVASYPERRAYEDCLAEVGRALDTDRLYEALAVGQELDREQMLAFALGPETSLSES